MRMMLILSLLICAAFPALAQVPLKSGGKVAFLGITYLDTSNEGELYGSRPEELARIELLEELVRKWFTEHGLVLMDLSVISEELDRVVNPAKCYGCDFRMARKIEADYVLVGEVQKVSNLILAMNLQLREVETERMARGLSVDIRSNTDDSWLRGMRYILKNNIFREKK